MRYIGILSSDARGKLGGVVFTRGRNGTNMKAHAVGINPRSQNQQLQRSRLAQAIVAWKLLTPTEQASWIALAIQYTWTNSLAQVYSPTGMQLFTQAWIGSNNAGTSFSNTAPLTPPIINPVTYLELYQDGDSLAAYFYDVSGPFTGYCSFSLSGPISNTINYTKGTRRRQFFSNGGGDNVDVTSLYTGYYGQLPGVGSTVSYHVVTTDHDSGITASPFTSITGVYT